MDQQAGRRLRTAPDAAAQLVQRGQAEALGLFDQHDRRLRHIHADLDDGGRDQKARCAGGEIGQRRFPHRQILQAMGHADQAGETGRQFGEAILGGHRIIALAAGDGADHPVGAFAARQRFPQPVDDVGQALLAHDAGGDGLAAGGFPFQSADGHLAPLGQQQRARDGGRGHHQHIRIPPLIGQHQPLPDPEAVLFIDDGKAEVVELHRILEQRMGADDDADPPGGEAAQNLLPLRPLHRTGQQPHLDPCGQAELGQRPQMLPRQQFGGRHQRALRARFDRAEHRQHRDQRLARADIALQQAQHAAGGGHVGADLGQRLGLAERRRMAEGRERLGLQLSRTGQGAAGPAALAAADQGDGDLAGQQFVIGQPTARGLGQGAGGALKAADRGVEGRPLLTPDQGGVGPFGQRAQTVETSIHRPTQALRRQVADQGPDRLDQRQRVWPFGAQRVQHRPAATAFHHHPPGQEPHRARRQQLLDPGQAAIHVADGERPAAGLGLHLDIRSPGGFRPRGAERDDLHLQHAILVGGGFFGAGDAAADDDAFGQMQQQVEHALAPRRLRQQLGQSGADAVQIGQRRQQPGRRQRVLHGIPWRGLGRRAQFHFLHRADRIPMRPYMAGPSP